MVAAKTTFAFVQNGRTVSVWRQLQVCPSLTILTQQTNKENCKSAELHRRKAAEGKQTVVNLNHSGLQSITCTKWWVHFDRVRLPQRKGHNFKNCHHLKNHCSISSTGKVCCCVHACQLATGSIEKDRTLLTTMHFCGAKTLILAVSHMHE